MKILRVQPFLDNVQRYNYRVNYGVLDCIDTRVMFLHHIERLSDHEIEKNDVAFLPMFKRWHGYRDQLERLKSLDIKTVLFDNDSCYRSFNDPFYEGIDFVFYRIKDQDGKQPNNPSHQLKWSVDADYFTPVYGGSGVSFNCTVDNWTYKLRRKIAERIAPTNYKGGGYVRHLQKSAAAIHTNSEIAPIPRAKMLEFAACGTQIISNRMDGIDQYFPEELITFFDDVDHLIHIIENYTADESKQKRLRKFVEEKHTDHIRAKEVIQTLKDHAL